MKCTLEGPEGYNSMLVSLALSYLISTSSLLFLFFLSFFPQTELDNINGQFSFFPYIVILK